VVAYELIKTLLELLASTVGLEGVAIGALAAGLVGLYYLREVAGLLVHIARYSRIISVVGLVLLVVFTLGSAAGVVEFGSIGTLINELNEVLR